MIHGVDGAATTWAEIVPVEAVSCHVPFRDRIMCRGSAEDQCTGIGGGSERNTKDCEAFPIFQNLLLLGRQFAVGRIGFVQVLTHSKRFIVYVLDIYLFPVIQFLCLNLIEYRTKNNGLNSRAEAADDCFGGFETGKVVGNDDPIEEKLTRCLFEALADQTEDLELAFGNAGKGNVQQLWWEGQSHFGQGVHLVQVVDSVRIQSRLLELCSCASL